MMQDKGLNKKPSHPCLREENRGNWSNTHGQNIFFPTWGVLYFSLIIPQLFRRKRNVEERFYLTNL